MILWIAGALDPGNPSVLSPSELQQLQSLPVFFTSTVWKAWQRFIIWTTLFFCLPGEKACPRCGYMLLPCPADRTYCVPTCRDFVYHFVRSLGAIKERSSPSIGYTLAYPSTSVSLAGCCCVSFQCCRQFSVDLVNQRTCFTYCH